MNRRRFLPALALGLVATSQGLTQDKAPAGIHEKSKYKDIKALVQAHCNDKPDYEQLWPEDSQILLVADRLVNIEQKNEILRNIAALKEQGLDTIILEAFDEKTQPVIDRVLSGDWSAHEANQYLQASKDHAFPEIIPVYTEIVGQAAAHGIKVLAVRRPPARDMAYLNNTLASQINVALGGSRRGLVLCEPVRLGYNQGDQTLNENLHYSNPVVVHTAGGQRYSFDPQEKHELSVDLMIAQIASELGLAQDTFVLPFRPKGPRRGDYMIHLPQTFDYNLRLHGPKEDFSSLRILNE